MEIKRIKKKKGNLYQKCMGKKSNKKNQRYKKCELLGL